MSAFEKTDKAEMIEIIMEEIKVVLDSMTYDQIYGLFQDHDILNRIVNQEELDVAEGEINV